MIDELLLLSGNDLPFPQARLTIHQPRIKEIAYITEQRFWMGCQLLKFNKNILETQDKNNLSDQSNFNIIMTMIQQKSPESYQARRNILAILTLMFPIYKISLKKNIILQHIETHEIYEINNNNFEKFKEIFIRMFCLTSKENKQYNPSGELAKKIVNKIKQGQRKRAELAPNQKIAIFSRYVSILAVGENKDINTLMNYTIYQLMDEYNRYNLKYQYEMWVKYRIAGAKDMKDPEDWFKDIHED